MRPPFVPKHHFIIWDELWALNSLHTSTAAWVSPPRCRQVRWILSCILDWFQPPDVPGLSRFQAACSMMTRDWWFVSSRPQNTSQKLHPAGHLAFTIRHSCWIPCPHNSNIAHWRIPSSPMSRWHIPRMWRPKTGLRLGGRSHSPNATCKWMSQACLKILKPVSTAKCRPETTIQWGWFEVFGIIWASSWLIITHPIATFRIYEMFQPTTLLSSSFIISH